MVTLYVVIVISKIYKKLSSRSDGRRHTRLNNHEVWSKFLRLEFDEIKMNETDKCQM